MQEKLKIWVQYVLPQHLVSRMLGFIAEWQWPWIKNRLIRWFASYYKIDLNEAVESNIEAYPTFNSFFTRALKPDAREICPSPKTIVSPADGVISQFGKISDTTVIQAKGHDYSIESLIGGNQQWSEPFRNGYFFTVYLAPNNYHRVHMPLSGMLEKMIYIPGKLFSVNALTAEHVPNLFTRNERVVSIFHSTMHEEGGAPIPVAVVMVGAMVVGGIHTTWAGQVTPPHGYSKVVTGYYQNVGNATILDKGAQMGHFSVGSTAIVLVGSSALKWVETLELGQGVRMGESLAELNI